MQLIIDERSNIIHFFLLFGLFDSIMILPATLKIYNASAGSGKTSFLVKNYLTILFQSSHYDEFKHILALTFTNKASEEMKRRILQCIKEFSNQTISKEYYFLFDSLKKDLKLTKSQLSEHSKKILSEILYDFSSFSISTIDKFTYRTIRSFSKKNMDLEMDPHNFLWNVVDNLYNKLKNSEKWSHILGQFSLEQLKKGKNWDIRKELFKIAHLLVEENSFFPIKKIKEKSLDDWIFLKKTLLKRTKEFEKKCKEQGEKFFDLLKKKSIQKHSFPYEDFPKFFQKLRMGDIIFNTLNKRLEKSIQIGIFYNKNTRIDQKKLIKENQKEILFLYQETKFLYDKYIDSYILDKLFLKNFNFLSIIHEIEKEIHSLKEEKNILLYPELNKILHERIIQEPYPHIYEKIGEKYKHYLIDEFQDISLLQWENIRILVENALSENGSAMIVGDPKQSIYNWRGGDSKSLIHIISSSSKSYHKEVFTIETNFRSYEEIVKFNNSLYQSVYKIFNSTLYKYNKTKQKVFKKPGGYVELNFVCLGEINYKQYIYCQIKNKIQKLLKQRYKLSDIAILVRNNEDGNLLSEKLMEDGFMVNTSVSLLIKNHLEIEIIVHFFYILFKPLCYQKRATLILLLLQKKLIRTKKEDHDFLIETLFLPLNLFLKKIVGSKQHSLDLKNLYNQSIYNIAEQIISIFGLLNSYNTSSIYSFLDFVHRYMKIVGNSIVDFLEYWEYKKEKESIIISDDQNIDAIRIMTIHKSKGLQFPVVILPFTDWNIVSKKKEGTWIDVCPNLYHGLDSIYLEEIQPYFEQIDDNCIINSYEKYLSKIRFDNLNLLYVATTRPMEQLIIFAKHGNDKSVSFYIKNFLKEKKLWKETKLQYSFGIEKKND
ncbi:MAG: UvrD-helicase domain-containing protein [Flavobacteriales bacterium]|jgi:ATP-dependent exoDNAse (exonuclease V) beta subunit|uniref:UvrD-helicase domain-containing protein n=1 Tax=Blattabacterium sp. (Mastotermes darwiniensis) TaxID=39768 RepID=UPI000231DDCE|nr:UvrD-helicase domain-containing protein [Blattabacterium sp. (Mastotermes darwiniensis)]AER40514.1 putative helicase [Blattabacterium sp. (Mastotermes darwiniensis) str. MADAR]MDR1804971.1 UvrD-helicase domain-containing protein [Flavobacteriales bacterium]